MGHLTEIKWESPKGTSLAHLWAEQMALLTEYCWVHPMEKSSEQMTEILMVMQKAWQRESDSVQMTENDSVQLTETQMALQMV